MPNGMILAAGRGTRLGPLTKYQPKPLLPVANEPVMRQGLRCLRAIGVREICANVSYHAAQITGEFGDGRAGDVHIHWSVEQEPTGTAGGMKGVQRYLDGNQVIVIAGDAMLDVDLAPLLAAHRRVGAFASLATLTVADPSRYGVVVTDPQHRIVRFQEKPAPGTEISRQANTGIYIFEPGIFDLIPAGTFYDFALDVFPTILKRRLPFYAFPMAGYWTDVGNPGDYLQANLDFLAGRIHIEGRGRRVGDSFIAPTARVAGTHLSRCVVGDNVLLAPGTTLTRCVVWSGTVLNEPRSLTDAVLTPYGTYLIEGKEAYDLLPAAVNG